MTEGAWRDALARTTLPEAGCYETSYPSTAWTHVPCSPATNDPLASDPEPARQPHQVGGGGGQVAAYVSPPSVISEVIGAFPSVTGVRSVHSVLGGASFGRGSFSLQINSDNFPTAACGANAYCEGWEQFVFGNHAPGGSIPSRILIQDWLLAKSSSKLTCPSGWNQSKNSCVQTSKTLTVPFVPAKNLGTLTMWGQAAAGGDSVFLAIGTKSYAMRNVQPDTITDLAEHWGSVQFNVVGDGGGSEAIFNPGSSVTVQVQVATGRTSAQPICELTTSTTAESNTLNLTNVTATPEPAQFPFIIFAETNARKRGSAQCHSLRPA